MSANPTFESSELKKQFLTEVVEDVPPPAYDIVDAEAAITPSTPPESWLAPPVKTFFLTILCTAAFAITTSVFYLYGSLAIGFPYNERSATYARVTYASILGSVILGPIRFTNQRFMTSIMARGEVVNTHMANGRLLKAFGCLVLLCTIVTGVAASAATFGYGLIFWPLVYSDGLTTEKTVIDAVLVPVACLFGGLRFTREVVSMMMWVLIRIPKISTGLEGVKYDRLIKIAYVFAVIRFSVPFLI